VNRRQLLQALGASAAAVATGAALADDRPRWRHIEAFAVTELDDFNTDDMRCVAREHGQFCNCLECCGPVDLSQESLEEILRQLRGMLQDQAQLLALRPTRLHYV